MKGKAVGLVAALVIALMLSAASPARAHDYERGNSDHVLRVVAYVVHPIGIGLEYAIFRPIHALATQPDWRILLGHDPRNYPGGESPVICGNCIEPVPAVECPTCHRMTLKPPDKLWEWK